MIAAITREEHQMNHSDDCADDSSHDDLPSLKVFVLPSAGIDDLNDADPGRDLLLLHASSCLLSPVAGGPPTLRLSNQYAPIPGNVNHYFRPGANADNGLREILYRITKILEEARAGK